MSDITTTRPIWPAPAAQPPRNNLALPEARVEHPRARLDRRLSPRDSGEAKNHTTVTPHSDLDGAEEGVFPLAAPGQQEDGGSAGGEEQGSSGGQGGSSSTGAAETQSGAPDFLDPRLSHVSDTIAMVCRYETAQCVWSARIPLDADLLPETVLHLAYSPALLALRFETSDWDVRSLLLDQLPALRLQVDAWLPSSCDVVITL